MKKCIRENSKKINSEVYICSENRGRYIEQLYVYMDYSFTDDISSYFDDLVSKYKAKYMIEGDSRYSDEKERYNYTVYYGDEVIIMISAERDNYFKYNGWNVTITLYNIDNEEITRKQMFEDI